MSAGLYLGVAIAGSVGAAARYVLDGEVNLRREWSFPVGTLLINVLGSLVLGLLAGAVLHLGAPKDLQVVLGTGFCGGFTTFSTASVEVVRLIERGSPWSAVTDAVGSLVLCLLAAGAGLALTAL